jgi:hypothetical protein
MPSAAKITAEKGLILLEVWSLDESLYFANLLKAD